ncbi:MAG TPA: hypothetical protein VEF06_11270, partial [Bryobacteraceae bacterium]|nr:hypothetical protein [Bryobacteraceae bacterium]
MKTQVTPAPLVSFGTEAVIVDDWPAFRSVEVAWRTTLLKSEGTPEQLVQPLLCKKTIITRQKKEGTP